MAVKVIKGDLLNATEGIIGHQVNCMGVMGSGVAKLIRDKYPMAFNNYKAVCDHVDSQGNRGLALGVCQIVACPDGKHVANLFGQHEYGRDENVVYTNYPALTRALQRLKAKAQEMNVSVALPFGIGCGLANGNWDLVSGIIESIFDDCDVTLYKLK